MPKKITQFIAEDYYLSNFFPAVLEYNGIRFLNSEAAFQAQKTLDKAEQMKFSNLPPNKAKALGRRVKLREDWEEVKDQIMYEVVKAKFEQNPTLLEKLLSTGNAYLEEGNTWGDDYWGVPFGGTGQNKLGHILMRLREEFRQV